MQFDRAVSWFGRYVESKLHEIDKDGHPLHKLEDLLNKNADSPERAREGLAALGAAFGVINNR